MIAAVADRVILAGGSARALLAVGSGAVGALAMPPFGIWPALALSLTLAVWLLDGAGGGGRHPVLATLGRAALAGWFWGFGYFVAGLWWVGAAFLVEADSFAWLLPFGVIGLPALLALFPALGFALARLIWSPSAGRLFALAFGLAIAEWARGHVLTGFPWNTLGLALGQNLWLMQGASVVGMWGLTVVAVLLLATPAALGTGQTATDRVAPLALAALVLAGLAGFGAWRVRDGAVPAVAGVKLRIMQPNLAQGAKFRASNGPEILRNYLALSDRAASPDRTGLADVTHLIWPESAFPFLLAREPAALAAIADLLRGGTVLVTGAARAGDPLPGEARGRIYNAIQAVGPDGAVQATYDKLHLVPFGEYVPGAVESTLRAIGIRQFVSIPGGFSAGERRIPFRVAGLPVALPTICYEAIFPDEMTMDGPRPGLILNVTNDGWFGETAGPYQHLAQARLRAVEQGLPLVRAANTGISAVIDPFGRVLAALPLGQEGVLDAALPSAAAEPPFPRLGSVAFWAMCVACGIAAGAARIRPKPTSRQDRRPARAR